MKKLDKTIPENKSKLPTGHHYVKKLMSPANDLERFKEFFKKFEIGFSVRKGKNHIELMDEVFPKTKSFNSAEYTFFFCFDLNGNLLK